MSTNCEIKFIELFHKKIVKHAGRILISHLTYISEVPFKQQVIYFNFDVHQLVQIKLGWEGVPKQFRINY